jgi:hypothetical protein
MVRNERGTLDREGQSGSLKRPIHDGAGLASQTIPESDQSGLELNAPSFVEALGKDLQALQGLLRWAHQCLSMPVENGADAETSRARARFVIEEARELLSRCRDEVDTVRALATIR